MTTTDRLTEIEARHQRNAVPDPHPESHDCRECSDARDIGALLAVVRAVEAHHRPLKVICLNTSHGDDCDARICGTCDIPWPCPTAAAVEKLGGAS